MESHGETEWEGEDEGRRRLVQEREGDTVTGMET